jgi:ribosomal protein S18 acetylase RimI-like enzyme
LVTEGKELDFTIEPLAERHNRAAFCCTNQELEQYLRKQAGQDLKKRASAPFVITPDHKTIAGFYTLSQYAISLKDVPDEIAKSLPKYPLVPATLLGRLAVDKQFLGQGVGELLLMDAQRRALKLSKQIASAVLVVDAKDEQAVTFYTKYGFVELPGIVRRLFKPMGTIARLFPEDV